MRKIVKRIKIDYAHALLNDNSNCHNIHGHSSEIFFTFEGEIDDFTGMVINFNVLKTILNETIVKLLDHGIAVNIKEDDDLIKVLSKRNKDKIVFINGEPTSEKLSKWAFDLVRKELLKRQIKSITLKKVEWRETENNIVIYEN